MKKIGTSEYLLSYFDILGYKNIINNLSESEESKLISDINNIIKKANRYNKKYGREWYLKTYSFSDNFLLVMKIESKGTIFNSFVLFLGILQEIQYEMVINYGLFIRGSIVKGQVYAGNNFVYGKGLINAYEIENKIAIFPRIIIDK